MKNKILNNKKNIILIISIILFLILTIIIFNNNINLIDQKITNIILNIRNAKLTDTMIIITNISSAYSLIAISILLLIIIKKKKIPLLIILNLISVFIISQATKLILKRPRPLDINLVEVDGFSYPSGHSMVSMAYFGFLAYLIYKNIENKKIKFIYIIFILIIISLIGFSRIYLGVHYLSDVIGGFTFAITYLMLFINYTKKYLNLKKEDQ